MKAAVLLVVLACVAVASAGVLLHKGLEEEYAHDSNGSFIFGSLELLPSRVLRLSSGPPCPVYSFPLTC